METHLKFCQFAPNRMLSVLLGAFFLIGPKMEEATVIDNKNATF